jgi:hypothetical protein
VASARPASAGAADLRCASCAALRQRAALDAVFEHLLAGFREGLLLVLQSEPDGPARHLRAYVRSIQGHALHPVARPGRWALVFCRPRYRAIWSEFAQELCAGDAFDPAQSAAVRHAAEALWYNHALASPSTTLLTASCTPAPAESVGALLRTLPGAAPATPDDRDPTPP